MNRLVLLLKKILPFLVLSLLVIIPLYPKIPLVDIKNTWVYIRIEDFLVLSVLGVWTTLLLKKQVTLKTPLTIPIFMYWLIGSIVTIHGVILIFPTIANVFPNVAFLAYLRHVEYLSLFFVAYSAFKNSRLLNVVIWTIVSVMLCVSAYGFGQKYLSFPAFLTMNEEYAKGIPVHLSELSRIPSTFAGHYDLAAYLVLIIPLLISLIFGFKNIVAKSVLILTSVLGGVLLFMTVSRVSFFVLFLSLFIVLFFHKRRLALIAVPILLIVGVWFLSLQPQLLARFVNTVQKVDVLVETKTGEAMGKVENMPVSYLEDKYIIADPALVPSDPSLNPSYATLSGQLLPTYGTNAVEIRYHLPAEIPVAKAFVASTGESLPEGSGYINLTLSPVKNRVTVYALELKSKEASPITKVRLIQGDYLIKTASAYDLSFTTRFQGEWPHAISAFFRNILFGSGYGSVSLAVDNNYLRILGETGLLGMISFIAIFIVFGIYVTKTLPYVESRLTRSFVLGLIAGVIGLALNAILIDVFEASKIAFQLWILIGITAGVLSFSQKKEFFVYKELLSVATSKYAFISYFIVFLIVLYLPIINHYFIGDDFTWFAWAANCEYFIKGNTCSSPLSTIAHYFTNSDGFFYRPGTKTFFLLMYPTFWLNQVIYHSISIFLHITVVILLFLLLRKILKDKLLSVIAIFLYIMISGYLEAVVWTSATGHLINAVGILLSLHFYILWDEKRKIGFFILALLFSFISTFFHELGIVTPLLFVAYQMYKMPTFSRHSIVHILKTSQSYFIFIPSVLYLIARFFANTYWFAGDYNYNLAKFPLNLVGNSIGYFMISFLGPISLPVYEKLRFIARENLLLSSVTIVIVLALSFQLARYIRRITTPEEKKVIIFSLLFSFILLLPFIGLGNISFRYSYLSSFGVAILFALFIKRLYKELLAYGKDTAMVLVATVFMIFSLFHVIQSQQTFINWNGAGVRVKNFLGSLEGSYDPSWSKESVKIYFINLPIKYNSAWVFPVGLEDAIWFVFDNPKIQITRVSTSNDIPKEEFYNDGTWVFNVLEDGSVKRIQKNRPTTTK